MRANLASVYFPIDEWCIASIARLGVCKTTDGSSSRLALAWSRPFLQAQLVPLAPRRAGYFRWRSARVTRLPKSANGVKAKLVSHATVRFFKPRTIQYYIHRLTLTITRVRPAFEIFFSQAKLMFQVNARPTAISVWVVAPLSLAVPSLLSRIDRVIGLSHLPGISLWWVSIIVWTNE